MPVVHFRSQDNYWKTFGSGLADLLEHERLTDLRFVTMDSHGGNVSIINAHQFIFSSKSSLLRQLFFEAQTKQLTSDPVVLTLPGVDPSSVQALINYFYFGYTDIDVRDDLEDICNLLGIVDIDLDDTETDIKWCDYLFTEANGDEGMNDKDSLASESSSCSSVSDTSQDSYSSSLLSYVPSVPPDTMQETREVSDKLKCSECALMFNSEESYSGHNCVNQNDCSSSSQENACVSTPRKKSRKMRPFLSKQTQFYQCKSCDKHYNSIYHLRDHVLSHYKSSLFKNFPPKGPFRCPDCPKIAKNPSALLRHYSYSHGHIYTHLLKRI